MTEDMTAAIEFDSTPLARSLATRYGWTLADWAKLIRAARDRKIAAHLARKRGGHPAGIGRAVAKVHQALAREFGATADELVRIERFDRGGMGVVGSGLMPERFRDLFFALNCLDSSGSLGPSCVGLSIDAAFAAPEMN